MILDWQGDEVDWEVTRQAQKRIAEGWHRDHFVAIVSSRNRLLLEWKMRRVMRRWRKARS